ncbi:MAG: hypothetical protein AAGA30_02285, partial [Planctomycetota bacterium]
THSGMTLHPLILRLAEIYGLTLCEFRPLNQSTNPKKLDQNATSFSESNTNQIIYYFGDIDHKSPPDQWMNLVPGHVTALCISKSGNTKLAIENRLCGLPLLKTSLLVGHKLTDKKTLDELCNQGAIPWFLMPHQAQSVRKWNHKTTVSLSQFSKENDLGAYLLHWTREVSGRAPDQTEQRFLDGLILGTEFLNSSRVANLKRILATQTIFASGLAIRGKWPVVCFSDRTVDELESLRVFRSHRKRWDFETIGIAIKKEKLFELGVMPVVYGGEAIWNSLRPNQQPYFQKSEFESTHWQQEHEWRLAKNLDLRLVGCDEAFVFVDSLQHAQELGPLSRWPIVVLGSEPHDSKTKKDSRKTKPGESTPRITSRCKD